MYAKVRWNLLDKPTQAGLTLPRKMDWLNHSEIDILWDVRDCEVRLETLKT